MHLLTRFLTKIRSICKTFVLLAALGPVAAFSQTLGWINWTAPGSYPLAMTTPQGAKAYANSASGSLALPGGGTTNVSFSGEVLAIGSAFGTLNNSFWAGFPANTFTSPQVPSLPSNSDRIAIAGYGVAPQQLTFSSPVQGLTMMIFSLGAGAGSGTRGTWVFNQPFTLLSQDKDWSSNTVVSQDCDGNTGTYCISGKEFSGTIIFQGSISTLKWTILSPEYYAAFNVGTTTAAAPVTISGTVSGLESGKSVVLQNNSSDNKTVSANGAFTFTNGVAPGSQYNVTVLTQPTGQTCTVTDGGPLTAGTTNVTGISVVCSASASYSVTTQVSPVGAGTITCTPNPVSSGGSTTCTATAAEGYTFSAFSGDCTGATCTLSNVTSAKSVTATFTQNVYSITTAVSPTGAGTISCTPNPVTSGGSTSCTATAASGYTFSAYSGDCTGATCTLSNVTSAKSVTATFAQDPSSIPTLSEWAMIILGSLMGVLTIGRIRRH